MPLTRLQKRFFLNAAALLVSVAVIVVVVIWPRNDAGDGQKAAGNMPEFKGAIKTFTALKAPPPVPEVAFTGPEGKAVDLRDFAGQVVLLNFWASWCAPCLREMPSLDALQKDLGSKDFRVVAVSVDRGGAKVAGAWLEKHGLKNLPPYTDAKSMLFRALGGRGMPTTWLIGRDGRVLGYLEGAAEWESPEAKTFLEAVIAGGAT